MSRAALMVSGTLLACGLVATSGIATKAAMADEPKVGDPAPDFSLPGSDGKTYTLAQLKGKTVVLAWFPKAFTAG